MNFKKVSGGLPPPNSTRESTTADIVSSARELNRDDYLQLQCTLTEARRIRQAIYRNAPSVKCRVNQTANEFYSVIIHPRGKERQESWGEKQS